MKKSRKKHPPGVKEVNPLLPEVNVQFAASGDAMTPAKVRALFCNPIYTGIGPFPTLIDDETWVCAAARLIHKEGAEQFLVNLLFVLGKSLETIG